MSSSDSEIIMSKRTIIFVLRGVPGSGKTTCAQKLYGMFYDQYNGNVFVHSRDLVRQHYCTKNSVDYQASFRNVSVNTFVRDRYYLRLLELLMNLRKPSVVIIDSTNTKINDLYTTFKVISISHCDMYNAVDVYLYTKRHEYKSVHNVPECIMERFREELKESDQWLNNKCGTRSRYVFKKV